MRKGRLGCLVSLVFLGGLDWWGLRGNLLWAPGDPLGILAHLGLLAMGEMDPLDPLDLQDLVDPQAMVLPWLSQDHLVLQARRGRQASQEAPVG